MTDHCRRCGSRLGAESYTATLTASTESTGTCVDYALCEGCWNRVREELRAGRLPA